MTSDELVALGNEKPVMYRGVMPVTFVCLSMAIRWGGVGRKQPMMARIRLLNGRERRVFPSQLSLRKQGE
jgi:hypothetical protein